MVRTDRPAMTIAVDVGRKATKQTNKQNLEQSDLSTLFASILMLNNKQTLSNVVITPHFQILPMSKVD